MKYCSLKTSSECWRTKKLAGWARKATKTNKYMILTNIVWRGIFKTKFEYNNYLRMSKRHDVRGYIQVAFLSRNKLTSALPLEVRCNVTAFSDRIYVGLNDVEFNVPNSKLFNIDKSNLLYFTST